jgi:hypothetical protein
LRERADELKGAINSKAQEFQTKIEGQKKKAIEEGHKFLQKTIPNLNADSIKNARGSAMDLGYTESELDNVYDARFVTLAWKASQYDKLQSGKAEAVERVQKAPPVVKPGGTQQGARDQKYVEARKAMRKDGNNLAAAARVFLMRGNK